MPREGVMSGHKDKTSVARWMSKGVGGNLREALAKCLGSLDSACGTSAPRNGAQRTLAAQVVLCSTTAWKQRAGSMQAARRQIVGRSCGQLSGRLCAECWQIVLAGNVSGRSGWLPCTFVGIQHGMMACHGLDIDTWRHERGEGNVSGRSGRLPCTFVGIQHGMMACHGLDIDTWCHEQKRKP
ncbi:hypothetical protein ACE6H2_020301 [Prunus campanulata]